MEKPVFGINCFDSKIYALTNTLHHQFIAFLFNLAYNSASPIICLLINNQSVSSVAQSCPTLHDPMNRSMPGLPVHHKLPEFTQTHAHRVGDANRAH